MLPFTDRENRSDRLANRAARSALAITHSTREGARSALPACNVAAHCDYFVSTVWRAPGLAAQGQREITELNKASRCALTRSISGRDRWPAHRAVPRIRDRPERSATLPVWWQHRNAPVRLMLGNDCARGAPMSAAADIGAASALRMSARRCRIVACRSDGGSTPSARPRAA
jgi:hypothetical protein